MAGKSLERILIIQTAFLGDVILATGMVEKVHQHYPDAQIDFLVRKGYEPLFENHPKIHQVIVFDKSRHKIINLFKVIWKVRSRRYDMAINIQRFFSTGLIMAFSKAIITIGFDKNPLSFFFSKKIKHDFNAGHEIARNHELISWFTDNQPTKPRLYPRKKNIETVVGYRKGSYACLAPASIWFTKQFPVNKWLELIGQIPETILIYLVGGPDDHDLCEEIKSRDGSQRILNLCGRLSLLDTAELMRGAKMNFVNDSAPMHIASAVNAPVCAIYCSTLPSFGYGPLSDQSHILEIRGDLYCRPCGIHGKKTCPEGHFRCAYDISIEQMTEITSTIKK